MPTHELYMHRCLELAKLGLGRVAPNPLVGAVLMHEGRIIGEGYHENYGEPHAEVNCLNSVKEEDRSLIPSSTLYVSLEPCAHFGKTPPCADLIIQKSIAKVVIGCRDPFPAVNGKGIEKLQHAGIEVVQDVLEEKCRKMNAAFFTFHTRYRPYILLKWAETADKKMAGKNEQRLLISNACTNRLVHKWRSEVMSILVGRNTALKDDPSLNTRLWPGKSPVRLVLDPELSLPAGLKLFDGSIPTIIFNYHQHSLLHLQEDWKENKVHFYQVTKDVSVPVQLSNALYQLGIQSVLVEGGARLLQSFIDDDLWDEARVITNEKLVIGQGLHSPVLKNVVIGNEWQIENDVIKMYQNSPGL